MGTVLYYEYNAVSRVQPQLQRPEIDSVYYKIDGGIGYWKPIYSYDQILGYIVRYECLNYPEALDSVPFYKKNRKDYEIFTLDIVYYSFVININLNGTEYY